MDRKPQIIAHSEKALNYTLFSCQWVPSSARFVVLGNHARNTGAIEVFELSKGSIKSIKSVSPELPVCRASLLGLLVWLALPPSRRLLSPAAATSEVASLPAGGRQLLPVPTALTLVPPNTAQCGTVLQAEKKAPIKCGTFGASSLHSRHLATGDFEGHLMTW